MELSNNKLIISYEKSITTRIGQNIGSDNIISQEALDRNIGLLNSELKKIKDSTRVDLICGMTTEAIRKAKNGLECIEKINKSLGIKLELITGDQEAFYTWLAIKHLVLDEKSVVAVCDIGGGSTEITMAKDQNVIFMRSFPIGVVRLEEAFQLTSNKSNLNKANSKLIETFKTDFQQPKILFLSGGTATSIATIMLGIKDYNPLPIEGTVIDKHKLDQLLESLFKSSIEQLKGLLRSDPGRYDVITAGVLMTKVIMERLHPSKAIVTTFGPRHGYLMNRFDLKNIEGIIYKLK